VQRAGEHFRTAGPLAPHWLSCSLDPVRAGAASVAHVAVENGGTATWRTIDEGGVHASYHWLDPLGNPIVWDGTRTPLPRDVAPGETVELELAVTAPRPPGPYRLAFDLVEEHRFWFAEVGAVTFELDVDVAPRIGVRALEVHVHGGFDAATSAALAAQDEAVVERDGAAVAHLVAGAVPPPGWSRLLLDAHEEGWVAVGTAVADVGRGRRDHALDPWRGGGRNPRFDGPLLLPSLLPGAELSTHLGLPAYTSRDGLFDGRLTVTLPRRSGRRPH